MSTNDLLNLLTELFFIFLGLGATLNYLRYPGATRRDIALMSASLAVSFLFQLIARVTGLQFRWFNTLGTLALLTQPYLLLRLAQYFYAVPRLIMRMALAAMILAGGIVILFEQFSETLAVIAFLALIAYFVAVDGYAMVIFVREAFATSGVVKQRMRFAAAGSGLLALALLSIGVMLIDPIIQNWLTPLTLIIATAAASSYYIGFVPPRWVRRAWQFAEIQNYFLGIRQNLVNKEFDTTKYLGELCQTAQLVTGSAAAAVVQKGVGEQQWQLRYATNQTVLLDDTPSSASILDKIYQSRTTTSIHLSASLSQGDRRLLETMDVNTLLVAPIAAAKHNWGLLLVFLKRSSLFMEDDLNLLTLLAQQSAVSLENSALVEEMRHYSEMLERKVEERVAEIRQLNLQLERRVAERTADLSRANAELGQVVRAKDEFLANMSHELRTPLNGILISAEVLLEQIRGPLNERQSKSLQVIQSSGRHLLSLINDILDLSKIEAGKLELQKETLALEDICKTSLQFVREVADKKQLRLSFHSNNLQAQMEADARRLKQILINLLSNAVKFTADGGQVTLQMLIDEAQDTIRFVVSDTGIGISAEGMNRLFKPFSQLDAGLTREHEGTGLGLTLVSRLVEMHGGSVQVESEGIPGKGSRFTVFLPWHRQPEPSEYADLELALANLEQTLHRLSAEKEDIVKALVIEDSPTTVEQIERYLTELGIQVVVYSPGVETLERVLTTLPNLVILDLLMPNRSGWEILAQLKADARMRSIPVMIISVVDEPARGLAAGAIEYLVKPITREQFRQALGRIVLTLTETEASSQAAAAPTAPDPSEAQGPLILLAEDNETNIQAIGEYLQDLGYRLVVARNGGEALDFAWEWKPDLILMDIQMPVLDGFTVMQRLRAMSEFSTTPIIALTALAMPGDRERCLAVGANEYLAKPVSLKQLIQIMNQLLQAGDGSV